MSPRSSNGRSRASRDNPGAWLMATAKHRAIDHSASEQAVRRQARRAWPRDGVQAGDGLLRISTLAIDDDIGDDLLRLMFTACHPVSLDRSARCAHTAIARRPDDRRDRARLPRPRADDRPAHRSRQANARRKARVPFEVPRGAELAARLSSVLEVIYLVFNEGYTATAGDDWMRPALCEEALRLGRILAELVPQEPEVHGLVALDGDSGVAIARRA